MNPLEPVRFGVLGVGRIARNAFAPALAASESGVLQAAASRDLARAREIGPVSAYDDYRALLADDAVEAVYIATHNGLHAELAAEAMRQGKHVLCEKPLGRDAAECESMVAVARETGRHLVEAFMYRHHPQIARARELVARGAIGELRTVEAAFSFHLTRRDDVRLRSDWGGGALLDVGCYCVNACRMFLGDVPRSVVGRGFFDPEHDVDLALHGILDYGEGRFGVLSSGFDGGLRNHVVLNGTEGTLCLPEAFIRTEGRPRVVLETEEGRTVHELPVTDVFRLELEDLARAIRTDAAPLLGPEEGLANARILDALIADARAHASIPAGER